MRNARAYYNALVVLLTVSFMSQCEGADFVYSEPIEKVAFGSCSNQDKEQPLWSHIARWDPDFFLWLGDAVYTDSRQYQFLWVPPSISRYSEQLHKMKYSPDYSSFQKRRTRIIGVWDDHDYGVNDGGMSDENYSEAVQGMFLHFLDEPEDSPRWKRKGLYASYLLGDSTHKSVKLILIDPRSQLNKTGSTVLGEQQWEWLAKELESDPTPITILATGLPLLTERNLLDKWLRYPVERERLLALISKRPGLLVLSGDSHFAEMQCVNTTRGPIFEVMSSGMTHNCLDWLPQWLCNYFIKYVSYCKGCISEPYTELNFGTISFIWSEDDDPKVVMEVRGESGVAIHYVVKVEKVPTESCPERHEVKFQLAWWVCSLVFITVVLVYVIMVLPMFVVNLFKSRSGTPHPHRD